MPTKTRLQKRIEMDVRNRVNVLIDGKYSKEDIEKIERVCRDGIRERDWNFLKAKYKLPDRARAGLDSVIVSYWDWRSDTEISKSLAPKLKASLFQAARLKQTVMGIRTDRDFFKGFHAYYDQSPAQLALFLEETVESLQKLEAVLQNAQVRTAKPAHRPTHRAVMHTLRILAELMEIHGSELNDDPESIAYFVLSLADPKLSKRAIRAVLKELVSTRPLWSWTGVWVEDKFR